MHIFHVLTVLCIDMNYEDAWNMIKKIPLIRILSIKIILCIYMDDKLGKTQKRHIYEREKIISAYKICIQVSSYENNSS